MHATTPKSRFAAELLSQPPASAVLMRRGLVIAQPPPHPLLGNAVSVLLLYAHLVTTAIALDTETSPLFEVSSSDPASCAFRNCTRLQRYGAVLRGEWKPQSCAAECRRQSITFPEHDRRRELFFPIKDACWAPCHTDFSLDVVGIPLIRMEPAAIRECVQNRFIVVVGNSVSRIFAWGMHNIATNYSLLQRYPDEPALWGYEERIVDPFWGAGGEEWLEEVAGAMSNDEIDPATMNQIYRAQAPKLLYTPVDPPRSRGFYPYNDSPYNDDTHFINQPEFDLAFLRLPKILQPGPIDAAWSLDRALESLLPIWGRLPDVMLLNIGVRTVEEKDLGYVEMSLERLLFHVRQFYPSMQLVWHTIPASLDERRIKWDLSKNQLDEKIRVHNRVHTEVCTRLNVPIFDMHGLTALVDPELTWDGLHFVPGTGVAEALANVLFNLVCL